MTAFLGLISFKRMRVMWLVLLLCVSAVVQIIVARNASETTDEPLHVKYGKQILRRLPDRISYDLCDSQMPISILNAAPLEIASHLEDRHLLRPISEPAKLLMTRVATILATLALALLVYFWAYDLYGEAAALASCLLCTLSPNLIAHGTLATTDMYHAVGVVGSLLFFRRFLLRPTLRSAFISGLTLALAQTTKPFALALYGVVFIAIALVMFRPTQVASLTSRRVLLFTGIAALCFVAVINVAFCFDRTFKPLSFHLEQARQLNMYSMFSERVRQLPLVGYIPVPVPYPFVQGFVLMKHIEETALRGDIYLLGELRNPRDPAVHGFKSYYAVAYFYKEPTALQILFLWGLVWVSRNRKFRDFVVGEGLLLTAAAILVIWFSFFSKAQIGIRHILPALAIETIIAGAAFSNFPGKPWPQKALLAILVLWLAGSVASYYPQMIPYMNEWVRDRRFSYRILADSNLDWGQDDAVVQEFLHKNPDVILDPRTLVPGRILIRANLVTGVHKSEWTTFLARGYLPVAQVGYAHFLFVIPAKDIATVRPLSAQNP